MLSKILPILLLNLIVISCTKSQVVPHKESILVSPLITVPSPKIPKESVIISTPLPIPTSIPKIKYYTTPNIVNNFRIAENIKLTNSIPAIIDDKGNGIFVFNGNTLKINNFQTSGNPIQIDDDFGDSSVEIDEKGNGLIIWNHADRGTTSDSYNLEHPNYFILKYKIIKDYKPIGEIATIKISNNSSYNEYPITNKIKFNIDEKGNGELFITLMSNNETIKVIKLNVKNHVISESPINTAYFKGLNIYLDKNGNGLLTTINKDQKVALKKIKNLSEYGDEIQLGEKKPTDISIDTEGNGYIYWINEYEFIDNNNNRDQRGKLLIKKISLYEVLENEINLGSNYSDRNNICKLDQYGNGIVSWIYNFSSDINVREIKKFIPQDPIIIESSSQFKASLGIATNSFGDGLVYWDGAIMGSDGMFISTSFGRLIRDFTISKL